MAVHAKEVKHRLNSIKNTQKITKAMELVAASKMRKAVAAAIASRRYSVLALDIVRRLAASVDPSTSPMVQRYMAKPTDASRTILAVFSSNRGLCGAFNAHVMREVLVYIQNHPNEKVNIVSIGKRGAAMFGTAGIAVHTIYEKNDAPKDDTSIMNIVDILQKQFEQGTIDKVVVVYTDYHSPINQNTVTRQLFPFTMDNATDKTRGDDSQKEIVIKKRPTEYLYEPSQKMILETLLPRMAQVQLYQALLESNASEHSSRMVTMKNATDAASDMANDLTILFNQARQASITQEIAEISSAVAALS